MPKTTITFNGLLVFRPVPNENLCEVGVLRARAAPHAHILQIQVTPNPATGTGTLRLDPDVLESHVQAGNVLWNLDVELNGQPVEGIEVDLDPPDDRHEVTAENARKFGWIVNLEGDEFHQSTLARLPNRLQPVIRLRKGELFSGCLTDSIDVKQGPPTTKPDFGFISGAVGLEIDTSAGETPVLYFGGNQEREVIQPESYSKQEQKSSLAQRTELFRLLETNQRDYSIAIRNTPTHGRAGGHFHLFYERLFHQIGAGHRFDVLRHMPPIAPPSGRCPEASDPDPDPFKCGGVSVGEGSGPLG